MATRAKCERDVTIRHLIAAAIREVEPDAEIILYGSRARGDAQPDSDWDVLVLVDGEVGPYRERAVARRVLDLNLAEDEVIVPFVRSRQVWNTPLSRATPFHSNVARDGVRL